MQVIAAFEFVFAFDLASDVVYPERSTQHGVHLLEWFGAALANDVHRYRVLTL